MILMYDREAKYDPTLEETSDELLRLFLDEIELYFQNYYGTGADMVAKKEKEMFIKQLWDRSHAKGYVDPNSARIKWQNLLGVQDEEETSKRMYNE